MMSIIAIQKTIATVPQHIRDEDLAGRLVRLVRVVRVVRLGDSIKHALPVPSALPTGEAHYFQAYL
jgi:hypothetical protein